MGRVVGLGLGAQPAAIPAPLSQPLRALPLCHFSLLLHGSAELGAQGRKEPRTIIVIAGGWAHSVCSGQCHMENQKHV